jgi:hypothetical protein
MTNPNLRVGDIDGFLENLVTSGAVADVGAAVTDFDTNLTEVTNNHYNGLLCIFTSGVCQGQAHNVDVYTGGAKNLAFAASDQWTDAPGNGDAFVLVPDSGGYLKKIFTALGAIGATVPTSYASGTQACVIATEHFLSSPSVAGKFRLELDTINLAANDVLEVRAYKMVLTGGTQRVVWYTSYQGVQPATEIIKISDEIWNDLVEANAVRFSILQSFGVGRNVPWKVLSG